LRIAKYLDEVADTKKAQLQAELKKGQVPAELNRLVEDGKKNQRQ
jgi:hypothetical protein